MLMTSKIVKMIEGWTRVCDAIYSRFREMRNIFIGNTTTGLTILKSHAEIGVSETQPLQWPQIILKNSSRRLTQHQMRAICNSIEENLYSDKLFCICHDYIMIDLENGLHIQNGKTYSIGKAALFAQSLIGKLQRFILEQGVRLHAVIYLRSEYGGIGAYLKTKDSDGKEHFVELEYFNILFAFDDAANDAGTNKARDISGEDNNRPEGLEDSFVEDHGIGMFVHFDMNFIKLHSATVCADDLLPQNDYLTESDE